MTHKTEVGLTIPDPEDLYCINCKINPLNIQHPIIKSIFHHQILTCRLIIYSVRCCIASPSIQNVEDLIHVIVSKKFYSTGKLQEHLLNLQVQFTNPQLVDLKIYEACLKYMFTFKLAPHWNLVGKRFYLNGFNFLSLPCSLDAVEWNIIFNDDHPKLEIKPMKMNLLPFTLDYLSTSSILINNFLKNFDSFNYINLTTFQSIWIYVLPKLTKARVISVSKTLPKSCPFKNYNDLRRHWKNMYSYRLPKTTDGMLFYEVIFPTNPNQLFTYPDICILSKMPEFLICENKNKVAAEFIKNLSTNVHSVCGELIKIGNLFPPLNLEYSCVLKRKSGNDNDQNKVQSKTSADYIIKSANENMNSSSLFTFKGYEHMSTPMKNHSQKVFSIINNQKRNKTSMTKTNSQYLTLNNYKKSFTNQSYSQKSVQNQLLPERTTIIDNIDDICSYYDIPSMYSNDVNGKQSNQDGRSKDTKNWSQLDSESISTSDYLKNTCSTQSSNKKPVIKNIENVCFDLTDINRIRNTHESNYPGINVEQNLNFNKINQSQTKNLFHSTNTPTSFSSKNLSNNFNIEKKVNGDKQSNISTIDSTLKNETLTQISTNNDLTQYQNRTELCDNLRSLLSRFDLYNTYQQNDEDIEKIIYNHSETPKQSISFETTNKIFSNSQDNSIQSPSLIQNAVNRSKSSLFVPNSSIQLKYNTPKYKDDYQFQNNNINYASQPSLSNINITNQIEEKISKKLEYNCLNENLSQNKDVIINNSQLLSPNEASIGKKLLKMQKSPTSIFTSNSKLNDKEQQQMNKCNKSTNKDEQSLFNDIKYFIFDKNKNLNKKLSQETVLLQQNFQKYNLNKNTEGQTPFSISTLKYMNTPELRRSPIVLLTPELKCSPILFPTPELQYSPIVFPTPELQHSPKVFPTPESERSPHISPIPSTSEIKNSFQNKPHNYILNDKEVSNPNKLQLNSISNSQDNSDSLSILSQSTDSNASNYESYKLAYTEALTFD